MKKNLVLVLIISTFFLPSCSKESKFGLQQFVTRMESDFEIPLHTTDFIFNGNDGDGFLFYENGNQLTTLFLDDNNIIKGISLLLTPQEKIDNGIDLFCKMCCVLTGNTYEEQQKIFTDGKITDEYINYYDSNMVLTVGRYKYTVVCNEYSVTMFCEKV